MVKIKPTLDVVSKNSATKTNFLSATLLVLLFLPRNIKVNCTWQSTELQAWTELLGLSVPVQAKWKQVNIHKSAVTSILSYFNKSNFLKYISSSHSPNIGKIRVKIGQKTNYFFYLMSSCTNRFVVFYIFSHWNAYYQDSTKPCTLFLFFWSIFWIICFWLFCSKCNFKICKSIATRPD